MEFEEGEGEEAEVRREVRLMRDIRILLGFGGGLLFILLRIQHHFPLYDGRNPFKSCDLH